MLRDDKERLDGLRTCIDGKMRRYGLLFSVNGGAFAIAKLGPELLRNLDIEKLALGAIFFTEAMTVDIWAWGERLKRDFFESSNMVFSVVVKS